MPEISGKPYPGGVKPCPEFWETFARGAKPCLRFGWDFCTVGYGVPEIQGRLLIGLQ